MDRAAVFSVVQFYFIFSHNIFKTLDKMLQWDKRLYFIVDIKKKSKNSWKWVWNTVNSTICMPIKWRKDEREEKKKCVIIEKQPFNVINIICF